MAITSTGTAITTREEGRMIEPYTCWVANVVKERTYGHERELRNGTKHFSGGTKVYLLFLYSDGAVDVIGPHRRSHRLIQITMRMEHLTDFRLKTVYNQHVLKKMENCSWLYFRELPTIELPETYKDRMKIEGRGA
jgi:hypothetical protein